MARLSINPDELLIKSNLLAIEETRTINGITKQVPIEYLAEIINAREHISAKGTTSLKLRLGIDRKGLERLQIDDYLSYSDKAKWRLANLVRLLNLSGKMLDTDDFIGSFVFLTIRHENFETRNQMGEPVSIPSNKVNLYVRAASQEDIDNYFVREK